MVLQHRNGVQIPLCDKALAAMWIRHHSVLLPKNPYTETLRQQAQPSRLFLSECVIILRFFCAQTNHVNSRYGLLKDKVVNELRRQGRKSIPDVNVSNRRILRDLFRTQPNVNAY